MDLFEYIKSQLPQVPNSAIMKQLGASDELIEYVKETPENTNLNVIGSIINTSGGGSTDVWFTGTVETVDDKSGETQITPTATDKADIDALANNPSNYIVQINGTDTELNTSGDAPRWQVGDYVLDVWPAEDELPAEAMITVYSPTAQVGLEIEVIVQSN